MSQIPVEIFDVNKLERKQQCKPEYQNVSQRFKFIIFDIVLDDFD